MGIAPVGSWLSEIIALIGSQLIYGHCTCWVTTDGVELPKFELTKWVPKDCTGEYSVGMYYTWVSEIIALVGSQLLYVGFRLMELNWSKSVPKDCTGEYSVGMYYPLVIRNYCTQMGHSCYIGFAPVGSQRLGLSVGRYTPPPPPGSRNYCSQWVTAQLLYVNCSC